MVTIEALPDRIAAKLRPMGDCWLWTACVTSNGYGQVAFNGKRHRPHRLVYELLVEPIPPGLQIDHVADRGCTSKLCCNPAHLEPVSGLVNTERHRSLITHCPKGHEYTPENTRLGSTKRGGTRRCCRACSADRHRARRAG